MILGQSTSVQFGENIEFYLNVYCPIKQFISEGLIWNSNLNNKDWRKKSKNLLKTHEKQSKTFGDVTLFFFIIICEDGDDFLRGWMPNGPSTASSRRPLEDIGKDDSKAYVFILPMPSCSS